MGKLGNNTLIGIAVLVLAALYLWFTRDIATPSFGGPVNARVFPFLIGGALALVGLSFLIPARRSNSQVPTSEVDDGEVEPVHYPVLAGLVLWTMAYYLAFERAGFILATVVYLGGLLIYFHPGHPKTNLLVAILFPVGCYILFSRWLGLVLPHGILPIG